MIEKDKVIEVKSLYKNYGKVEAVKGIDFYVNRGEMFAFLGPNGAGKSTTIDILTTFLEPTKGEAIIDGLVIGKDDFKIKEKIGAVFQDGLLDTLLTVEENLRVRGGFYNLSKKALNERISYITKITEIENILKRPYGKLSGGQRRRADIARALINTPTILFLDEPTTGLDPQTRKLVWGILNKLRNDTNLTIFLTTHYMEEAAESDYVIVIDEGRISAKGTPTELKEKYTKDKLLLSSKNIEALKNKLDNLGQAYTIKADTINVNVESYDTAISLLNEIKDDIYSFEMLKGTMDDAFIEITGKELRV